MAKTVLITGCNRGIGREAVRVFAEHGYDLICCIRRPNDEFASYIAELSEKHAVAIDLLCFDMADESAIKTALTPLIKSNRKIDVLVNNAGIASGGLLHMTSMAKLKEVFQINFFSQVLITQLVSKLMIRHKCGSIINMGSIAGLENFSGYTSYGSSKAALMFFTRTIAKELAPHGVRVNSVAPGLTDTNMATQMEEKAWAEMIKRTDLQRLGHPNEVVSAILWLASDATSFITGQIIRVDGGM